MKDKVTRSLIRKYAVEIARQFHPNKIILFGSYAYDKPNEDSDVDIFPRIFRIWMHCEGLRNSNHHFLQAVFRLIGLRNVSRQVTPIPFTVTHLSWRTVPGQVCDRGHYIIRGSQKPGAWFQQLESVLEYNTHKINYLYTQREAGMRTNIVLDDKLVERAQKLTGIKTKREVVHEALRTLILLSEQAEIRNLRGKLKWDGNLGEQRLSRFGSR